MIRHIRALSVSLTAALFAQLLAVSPATHPSTDTTGATAAYGPIAKITLEPGAHITVNDSVIRQANVHGGVTSAAANSSIAAPSGPANRSDSSRSDGVRIIDGGGSAWNPCSVNKAEHDAVHQTFMRTLHGKQVSS